MSLTKFQLSAVAVAVILLTVVAFSVDCLPPPSSGLLLKRYDHSGIGQIPSQDGPMPWTKYDTLIVIHASMMFVAWQILAPIAIMIASVARNWTRHWLRMHWLIQVGLVFPLTVVAVVIGTFVHAYSHRPMDRHKILGLVVTALLFLQIAIGNSAAHADAPNAHDEDGALAPKPKKRTFLRWVHIAVGIALVTLAGLNVTWGFDEYAAIRPIPLWATVIHYVIAGVPLLIVGPIIFIRGLLRMRRGDTFAQAFFHRPGPPPYNPPRTLWLGSSTYVEGRAGELKAAHVAAAAAAADDQGYAYRGRYGGSVRGSRFSMRSYASTSTAVSSSWEGASTREEYEIQLAERKNVALAQPQPYDYPEAVFGESPAVYKPAELPSRGTGDEKTFSSPPPPLPPYPAGLRPTASTVETESEERQAPDSPADNSPQSYTATFSPPTLPPLQSVFTASGPASTAPLFKPLSASPSSASSLISLDLPPLDDPSNPFPSATRVTATLPPPPMPTRGLSSDSSAILASSSAFNSPVEPLRSTRSDEEVEKLKPEQAPEQNDLLSRAQSMSASVASYSTAEEGREKECHEDEGALEDDDDAENESLMSRAASGRWFGNRNE